MKGLICPSEQRGGQFQQRDGQAWVEELTDGARHSGDLAQCSCALSFQSWCCDGIHENEHFGKQSRRSQTPLDPE